MENSEFSTSVKQLKTCRKMVGGVEIEITSAQDFSGVLDEIYSMNLLAKYKVKKPCS